MPAELKHSSLNRVPQVTSVANDQLHYAHIVTDGVLISKFNRDLRAMVPFLNLIVLYKWQFFAPVFENKKLTNLIQREIDRIAARNEGKSREVMGALYSNWFFGNFSDDISSVTIQYQK